MKFNDHDLRQIDEGFVESLDLSDLRTLVLRLLEDLKEARERLNQNPSNSSRPPGSQEPWIVAEIEDEETEKEYDCEKDNSLNEASSDDERKDKTDQESKRKESKKSRKAGKQKGAQGFGRTQKIPVTGTVIHNARECSVCGRELSEEDFTARTGHYVIDIVLGDENNPGIIVTNTKHIYGDSLCSCGHVTHTAPNRCENEEDWDVELTEWHLVGPMLESLICCLAMRMRLSRGKIREFLHDWLKILLSVGTINKCIHEAGRAVEPVEEQLLSEIRSAELVYGDETSWPEKGVPYWLWGFATVKTVLFTIGRRTKETVKNILNEDFDGWLMSDGYNAYREYVKRLRCWAHLERKAEGISESLNKEAQRFGEKVLDVFKTLMESVYRARAGPTENLVIKYKDFLEEFKLVCEKYRGFAYKKTAKIYEKTQALAREFLNDWEAIFRVLEHPELPLTNNEIERIFRHWVILRRICYGTKTKQGSRVLALLASAIETCRLRKASPWIYLAEVIAKRRQGHDAPPIPDAPLV